MTYVSALILAFGSVVLNVIAQILLKKTSSKTFLQELNFNSIHLYLSETIFTYTFIIGLSCAFIASIMYLISLNKLPLSVAFPFTGLSFAIIFTIGIIFFGEKLTIVNFFGLLLILLGIALITLSS